MGVEALQGETTYNSNDMRKEVLIEFGESVMKVVLDRVVKRCFQGYGVRMLNDMAKNVSWPKCWAKIRYKADLDFILLSATLYLSNL